jgi:hypothetical protein
MVISAMREWPTKWRRAILDRYIGYSKPYATSHEELDADEAVQEEVHSLARALAEGVGDQRGSPSHCRSNACGSATEIER